MNEVREAIVDKIVSSDAGVSAEQADTLVVSFVQFYSTVAAFNQLADAAGVPRHPESNPDREALALLLADTSAGEQ